MIAKCLPVADQNRNTSSTADNTPKNTTSQCFCAKRSLRPCAQSKLECACVCPGNNYFLPKGNVGGVTCRWTLVF